MPTKPTDRTTGTDRLLGLVECYYGLLIGTAAGADHAVPLHIPFLQEHAFAFCPGWNEPGSFTELVESWDHYFCLAALLPQIPHRLECIDETTARYRYGNRGSTSAESLIDVTDYSEWLHAGYMGGIVDSIGWTAPHGGYFGLHGEGLQEARKAFGIGDKPDPMNQIPDAEVVAQYFDGKTVESVGLFPVIETIRCLYFPLVFSMASAAEGLLQEADAYALLHKRIDATGIILPLFEHNTDRPGLIGQLVDSRDQAIALVHSAMEANAGDSAAEPVCTEAEHEIALTLNALANWVGEERGKHTSNDTIRRALNRAGLDPVNGAGRKGREAHRFPEEKAKRILRAEIIEKDR